MRLNSRRPYRILSFLSILLLFGVVFNLHLHLHRGVEQASGTAQGDAAWYAVLQSEGTLWAIDTDANGNGWLAGSGTTTTPTTRMIRLQNNRLVRSNYVFSNTTLIEIALSEDGRSGWAAGNGSAQNSRAVLLRLENGAWTELQDRGISSAVSSLSDMALDADARNGWALGLVNAENARSSRVLRLLDGRWSVAETLIPPGVGLVNIAADAGLKHVWASGYDENGDAALLYLRENQWIPVSTPIGNYVIFDLAVDANGDGWAGLDTNDEPANSPSPTGFARFRADGSWTLVETEALALSQEIYFSRLEVDATGKGWAFGNRLGVGAGSPPLVILRLDGDELSGQQYPDGDELAGPREQQPLFGQATDLALGPQGVAWAVTFEGQVLRYGAVLPPGGAIPAPAPRLEGGERCFPETNKCLHGVFMRFWLVHGGLERFGLPVTGELWERLEDGNVYRVQYTERARFEQHLETSNPNFQVLLGLLGNRLAEGRKDEAPFGHVERKSNSTYFPETGHNLSGEIADFWQRRGGLIVFGYPISEAFVEKSPTDGKEYLVQYFERNRLELHPEATDPKFRVQLGLLGVQQFERVYGRRP